MIAFSDPIADVSLPVILDLSSPGTAMAAMMLIIATTMSNSIRVKPLSELLVIRIVPFKTTSALDSLRRELVEGWDPGRPVQRIGGSMTKFFLWVILLVICWPVALLALVLYPFVWLLLLPFRVIGIAVDGVFAFLKAVVFLPARVLGGR